MRKDVFRRGMVLAIICLFIWAGVVPSITGYTASRGYNNEGEMAFIQIDGNLACNGGKKIEISLSEAYCVQSELSELTAAADAGTIDGPKFIEGILTIFINHEIFPSEYTYENLVKNAERMKDKVEGSFAFSLITKLLSRLAAGMSDEQYHLGGVTIGGSVALGGRYALRVEPLSLPLLPSYFFINQSFEWSNSHGRLLVYGNADFFAVYYPGIPATHAFVSLIALPGQRDIASIFWTGESYAGIMVFPFTLGVYCYTEQDPFPGVVLFDAAVQIIGVDVLIKI